MKRFLICIITLLCIIGHIAAQSKHDVLVGNALNGGNTFELRHTYEAGKDSLTPMIKCFAESILAHYLNKPQEACNAIDSLVKNHQQEIGISNVMSMLYLKSLDMGKLGKYDEAAQMLDKLITTLTPHIGDSSLVMFRERLSECREYAKIGNINSICIPEKGARIPFRIDSIGPQRKRSTTITIPGEINGKQQDMVFDTGAGANIVSEKTAAKLGLRMLDINTKAKGFGIQQGRKAIADKLCMGDIIMRNVPFIVMDISSGVDSIDVYMRHLEAVIGVEFMNAAKEVQIDFANKEIFVPYTPSVIAKSEKQNLAGNGNGIFEVEVSLNGDTVPVGLDTGAGNSNIGFKYFANHKEYIRSNCEPDTLRGAGAGGVQICKAFKLKNFPVSIGGIMYKFPEIFVSTEDEGISSARYGNLGMDFFTKFKKMTINTKDMFVRIK